MSIVRNALVELDILDVQTQDAIIADITSYFDRREAHALIRQGINNRYAVGIKTEQDPAKKTGTYEVYTKQGIKTQVDAGIIEAIDLGLGFKIVNALATLTTEQGQKFSLQVPGNDKADVKPAEELLNRHRTAGGFKGIIKKTDKKSIQVGSCACYVSFVGKSLKYQAVTRGSLKAFFGSRVIEDGIERAVDCTELEDASVVVLRLDKVEFDQYNYIAFYGASDLYHEGRQVFYTASSIDWTPPPRGAAGVIEYEIEGKPCNPLTYLANRNPERDIPEYPFAIIHSGLTDDTHVMPFSQTLYDDSIEFDIAASHELSASQKAAAGLIVIERNEQAMGLPLPKCVDGVVALAPGEKMHIEQRDSAALTESLAAVEKLAIHTAAGWGVPDYMVISQDHTLDASSGVALQVKTRPLAQMHVDRVELNQHGIRKIFEIEKALIELFDGRADAAAVALLVQCDQDWQAGELRLPENRKEVVERIQSLTKLGLMDTITAIREYYQLPTDEDAIEFYEKMNQRKDQYQPLNFEQLQQEKQAQLQATQANLNSRQRQKLPARTPNGGQSQ